MPKTIKLSRTYEVHGAAYGELVLRDPTWADYVAVGAPFEQQPAGDGVALITHYDRLGAYASRLAKGGGDGLLNQLDLADGFAVEKAIGDFFTTARRSTAPTTSSSGAPEKA